MRVIVLGAFVLAEICGVAAYLAADRGHDVTAFDLDTGHFGHALNQSYEELAWGDLVRRAMLAEGNPPAVDADFRVRSASNGNYSDPVGGPFEIPEIKATEAAILASQ